MFDKIVLSLGDGETSDYLNLLDSTKHVVGSRDGSGGIFAPVPATDARTRTIQVPLLLVGTTADTLWANRAAIDQKLEQAITAVRNKAGIGVTLGLKPGTRWVYFDVIDGSLSVTSVWSGGIHAEATLTLSCLPYGRGDAVTETVTSTLTNGPGSTWFVDDIVGDTSAPARLTIADESDDVVINGVHVFSRSGHGLGSGDFDPCIEVVPASPGFADTDDSSYSGDGYAALETTSTWQTAAAATRPSGAANNGMYDVWVRMRNRSPVPSAPGSLEATVNSTSISVTDIGSDYGAGSSTIIQATLTQNTPVGTMLIMAVRYAGNTGTITPSGGGGTWTLLTDGVDTADVAGSGNQRVAVYWSIPTIPTVAGVSTYGVTFNAGRTQRAIRFFAVTGLAASSPVEQVSADKEETTTNFTTNSITTTQAQQLLIAAATNVSAPPATYNTVSQWTRHGDGTGVGLWYRRVTTASTYNITVTTGASDTHIGTLASFKALYTSASNLSTGTWNLYVVAVSSTGDLSPVSNLEQVTVSNTTDAITLTWDAPVTGDVASYRVYRNRGTGWGYFSTGSTDTTYTWTTESGITASDPILDGDFVAALFRVQAGLSSGTNMFDGPTIRSALSGEWEDVFAGTFSLPPKRDRQGAAPDAWLLRVQGKGTADLDVDLVWLMPHGEPQARAKAFGTLTTKRDWVIEGLPDGDVTGQLYESETTNDAGSVDFDGPGELTVGPGATQIAIRCTIAGGISDVTNAKFTAILRYIPLYRYFPGSGA